MSTDDSDGDVIKTCIRCFEPFVLTADERSFFVLQNLLLPKRCKPCRAVRRAERLEREGTPRDARAERALARQGQYVV
jgi:hypothetical protein